MSIGFERRRRSRTRLMLICLLVMVTQVGCIPTDAQS